MLSSEQNMKIFISTLKIVFENIGKTVEKKLNEIKNKSKCISNKEIFEELCFCILVANTNLEKTLKIWETLKDDLFYSPKNKLSKRLKSLGYRFYNKRAEYIVDARKKLSTLLKILKSEEPEKIREWLVENIKGIGWKEASHFLRNLGYENFAILDRHVLRILKENKVVDEIPKTLTKRKYLEIEEKLKEIVKKLNKNMNKKITLAALDLVLFYLDTKKICEK